VLDDSRTGDVQPDDVALEAVLAHLCAPEVRAQGPFSLARLSKRAGLRMSSLLRVLTALEVSGLVELSENERGVSCVALSVQAAASLDAALDAPIAAEATGP
jgi:DNA-binding IclR family transcriptional regulator